MIDITNDNEMNFKDKPLKGEEGFEFKDKSNVSNKFIMSLFYTVFMLSMLNGALVYIFYKILVKL